MSNIPRYTTVAANGNSLPQASARYRRNVPSGRVRRNLREQEEAQPAFYLAALRDGVRPPPFPLPPTCPDTTPAYFVSRTPLRSSGQKYQIDTPVDANSDGCGNSRLRGPYQELHAPTTAPSRSRRRRPKGRFRAHAVPACVGAAPELFGCRRRAAWLQPRRLAGGSSAAPSHSGPTTAQGEL